jgi:hypothetical protein
MKTIVALVSFPLMLSIVALHVDQSHAQSIPKRSEIKLAPGKTHQRCTTINPPQKLSYEFTSSERVNFQIRYQRQDQAYFPVKQDRVLSGSDVFVPATNDEYCMIWENRGSKESKLDFSYRVFK